MATVLQNSGVFLLIIFLGQVLKRAGIFKKEHRQLFSFLLLNVTLPGAIISGFDLRADLGPTFGTMAIVACACALFGGLAVLHTRGKPPAQRAVTLLMSNGYYIAPFTLPFVQANMGAAAVTLVAGADIAQSVFNMGINYVFAAMIMSKGSQERISPWLLAKNMLKSGPLVTYGVLLLCKTFGIVALPSFIVRLAGTLGGANTLLGMLFIGLVLDLNIDFTTLRQLLRICAIRYGGAIVVSLACFTLLPLDLQAARVVTLALLCPVSNAAIVYSEKFQCDSKIYGAFSSISFLVGIVSYFILFMVWA